MSQDGEISYFREAGEPILDSDRDLDHTIGIVQDVTELLLSSVPEMDPDWLDDLVDRRKRGEAPTAETIASRPL